MQTMHGSTGPNTLIITDILHDDILSMNIVSDKHEQASQSGWLGLQVNIEQVASERDFILLSRGPFNFRCQWWLLPICAGTSIKLYRCRDTHF